MKKLFFSLFLILVNLFVFAQKETTTPLILGVSETFFSKELNEKRTLNIYLPDDYKKDDTTKYSVIYLLDGSINEDFIHIVGLVQYNTFPWINQIPKSIVVGIANVDRKRDFTSVSSIEKDAVLIPNSGGSKKFISFIEKELQPYIESKYKTNSSNMLIGQSLGGLVATEILFTKPKLFNNYIIISPSLWWNDGALLKFDTEILHKNYNLQTNIYIGVGKEGAVFGKKAHIMEKDAQLLANKIQQTKSKKVKVYFDYLPNETHATVTHQSVFNAFRILYNAKKK